MVFFAFILSAMGVEVLGRQIEGPGFGLLVGRVANKVSIKVRRAWYGMAFIMISLGILWEQIYDSTLSLRCLKSSRSGSTVTLLFN